MIRKWLYDGNDDDNGDDDDDVYHNFLQTRGHKSSGMF